MKLFLVTLRGLYTVGVNYHESYVVADDPYKAYQKVRSFLDAKDYGFKGERELSKVELLADEDEFNATGVRLFL